MPLSPRTLRPSSSFTPKSISGLALWLDASQTGDLYTTDAGPVTAVSSPTEISGCVLWLDGADNATITASSGLVSQWTDKSATGAVLTASGSARPTLSSTGFNSRQAIVFNGTSTNMASVSPYTATNGLSGMTRIAVCANPANTLAVLSRVFSGGSDMFINMNGSWRSAVDSTSGTNYVASSTFSSANVLPAGVYADLFSSGTITQYGFGSTATATVNGTIPSTTGTGTPTLHVGSNIGANFFWNGPIAEVIYFNRALTRAELARVEAYLAAKWGISGVHRAVEQEIAAVGSPLELSGCAGWWDASRTDKMWSATSSGSLVANGGAVLRLEDLSGNGKHLIQATSASAPLRQDGAKNGLPVLNFAGTKSLAAGAAGDWNFLHNTQGGTVIAVIKPFDTADPQTFAYGVSTNVGGATNQVGWASFFDDRPAYPRNNYVSQSVTAGVSGQTVISQEQNNALSSVNDFSLFSFTPFAGSSTTAGRAAMYVSGASVGSANSSTLAPTAANSNNALTVGIAGGNSIAGLAELIVFSTVLSAVDRARVEKYLQQKWATPAVPDPTPPVGHWRDRSGNGRHATQATGANRPAIHSSTQNNRRVLSFDGSNDVFLGTGAQALKDGMTVVGAYASGNVNFASLFAVGDSAAGKRWVSGSSSSRIGADFYTNAVTAAADSRNRTDINAFTFSTASNSIGVRINGAQALSQSSLSPALAAFASNTFAVGGVPAANEQWWSGRIFELAVYNRVLSASECRRIEQALAAKWGIVLAPQVSNADAQDWINRVYANGGTVTSSTASAVNSLCVDLANAGLRDRFYRLNLFCGTGLNAALVPLYRGPSLGGTQYGNTTDTNVGPFVSGDYVETGASGGLQGSTATAKRLRTGLAQNTMPTGNLHLSAYNIAKSNAGNDVDVGARSNAASQYSELLMPTTTTYGFNNFSVNYSVASDSSYTQAGAFMLGSCAGTAHALYKNGSSVGTSNAVAAASTSSTYSVFSTENEAGAGSDFTNARLGGYSIGLSMTAAQAAAYYTAMQAFQTALGRNV